MFSEHIESVLAMPETLVPGIYDDLEVLGHFIDQTQRIEALGQSVVCVECLGMFGVVL